MSGGTVSAYSVDDNGFEYESDAPIARTARSSSLGFWNFSYLVTPDLIKGLYAIIAVLMGIAGFLALVYFAANGQTEAALVAIPVVLISEILWRITCETSIIFFSIHERLSEISESLTE